MKTKFSLLVFLSFLLATGCSQNNNRGTNLNLNFEDIQDGKPVGWFAPIQKNYSVSLDSVTVKSGKYSIAIEYVGDSTYFQSITLGLPNNYSGKRMVLSGYIKTENVDGYAGLWMRIDPQIALSDMSQQKVCGTTDWTRYEIAVNMNPAETQQIVLGGLLAGKGKMWLDDLQITIDGKDIKDAKIYEPNLKKFLSQNEISALKRYTYPLRTYEPDDGDTKDLKVLDKLIGNSKVVALGEVSHGSSEIFKMKNRIIQYLSTQSSFDIFSIEANMPEAYKLNDYTVRREGDPKKLISGMYFWTWKTEEMLNMVEWMRKFNQPKQRIEYTGFDMQFYEGAIKELLETFKENEEIKNKVVDLKQKLDEIRVQAKQNRGMIYVDDNEMKSINTILSFLQQSIETSAFHTSDKIWLKQNIEIIQQYLGNNNYEWRDKCMADNFMWIKDHNPDSKFVIWAHNGHIQKTDHSMGSYLINKLGNDYTTFGFTFFDGSFMAVGNKGLSSYEAAQAYPGTLEYLLDQLNMPIFILDLKKIKSDNNKDTEWLMEQLSYRIEGAVVGSQQEFQNGKIADKFDYLIFIKTSTPSTLLPE